MPKPGAMRPLERSRDGKCEGNKKGLPDEPEDLLRRGAPMARPPGGRRRETGTL